MKKFLPYILILVVLVGFFGPVSKVKSQNVLPSTPNTNLTQLQPTVSPNVTGATPSSLKGTCYYTPPGDKPTYIGGKTFQECTDLVKSMGGSSPTWKADGADNGSLVSAEDTKPKELNCTMFGGFWECINSMLARLAYLVMSVAAFILWLSGTLLNKVIEVSILDMAKNIQSMSGINVSWKIIRDLMNIAFIFILVYEGILIIVGKSDVGKIKTFVSGVVLASLLINFSLFFTKVMIDASNIVTIGIYKTIIDTSKSPEVAISGPEAGEDLEDVERSVNGISVPFMNALGLTNFYSSASFADINASVGGGTNMLIFFIMGTVIFIIVAFAFFAISAMLVVRYITLLILLMLSPVAYMGMALPQMKPYAKNWWDSLMGQLLFAPVYMIMTLIILTLMQSDGFLTQGDWGGIASFGDVSSIGLIINFVVVIGLIIASLATAKKTATQGSAYIGQASQWLTGQAGNALMGGSGWVGRKFIGGAAMSGTSVDELEARIAKGGTDGTRARARLALAQGSFDARRSSVGEKAAKMTGVDLGTGLPFNQKAGIGGAAAVAAQKKKSGSILPTFMGGQVGEENLDKILKSYTDKRNWDGLRDYMKTISEKDAQYMYKKMNGRDRVSLDKTIGDPAFSAKLREKTPFDEQIRSLADSKEWVELEKFLMNKPDGTARTEQDQNYIYEKLSARDRVEFDKQLDSSGNSTLKTRMKTVLSVEEQDKTKEAEKKVKKAEANKAAVELVNLIATGAINPTTLVAFTPAEIENSVKRMPDTATRDLSPAARLDNNITMHLSKKQLADLMANGDPELTDVEARRIKTNIEAAHGPTHPVVKWLNDPIRVADWS